MPVTTLSGGNLTLVAIVGVIAIVALFMAFVFRREVLAAGDGTQNMQNIAQAVQEGASAFLSRQFRTLGVFAVVAFLLLLALPAHTDEAGAHWGLRIGRSIAFLAGAVFSGLIGYLGMWLATRANLRVAAAARAGPQGRTPAMKIAFRTGAHVGMATVGLGLLGAALVVFLFHGDAPVILEGFGFGAAMLAMFMRVGGGIFTKAADVGADLVGKVEQGIPEDDPRNAATIADNVGDNVGDCAGMAADLFESYAVTLVASLILGKAAFGESGLVFPLIIPAIGVITAMIGIFLTKPRDGENGLTTINRSFYLSAAISAVLSVIASLVYLPATFAELGVDNSAPVGSPRLVAIISVIIGIVLAAAILKLTGYYTGTEDKPVKTVGRTALTGAATVVLSGISLGPRVGRLHRPGHRRRRLRRVPGGRLRRRRPVRHRARRLRPADHGRRHRGHGHLRPGLRQRPGHRRDVGRRARRGRADPHRARRGRQHHQGHHQGHRDRHGGPGRHRAVRLLHRLDPRRARRALPELRRRVGRLLPADPGRA